MNDYERVATIIRFLDEHHAEQPHLDALAARVKLSPHHFHRLFTRWAGVTPKDFLQCLTLEQARVRLKRGKSVLDATLDAGLSSPSRLHDLCVALDSASPGEIKAGGQGWLIELGLAESPFGWCCIAQGPRGICHLSFEDTDDRECALAVVREVWPQAEFRWDNSDAQRLAARLFKTSKSPGSRIPLRAWVGGTRFQVQVWRALMRIPPGALVSYGQLAESIGHPGASRAVGSAVGSNPLSFLIPCHRVIRSTGVLGEYRWGASRKRAMLAWEGAKAPCSGGDLSANSTE